MLFPFVRFIRLTALGLLSVLAISGCAFFAGKPALPRNASHERGLKPSGPTDFDALVGDAEIVYFPAERAASGARSEASALLLDALLRNGAPFAIGWDLIEATQQPVLDEFSGKTGKAREEAIDRLELAGTGRAREHCRAVLRDARLAGVRFLALRCPETIVAKLEARERLTPEEQREFSDGYTSPAGGAEAYAERLTSSGVPAAVESYRAHVARQQFAAERIVRHFRGGAPGGKLLVFLRASDLEAGQGVPRYVAQKLQLRQLVLDSSGSQPVRARLLTQRPLWPWLAASRADP